MSTVPPAGWYPDPQAPHQSRYWDGGQWTAHTAPAVTAPQPPGPAASATPTAPAAPAAPAAPGYPAAGYQNPGYSTPGYSTPDYAQGASATPAGGLRLSTPQWVTVISILVTILAAFLPWVSAFGISKSGISADGVITLILAVIGLVLELVGIGVIGGRRRASLGILIPSLVLGALVALIGLIDLNDAGSLSAIGLYLTLAAGIGWVVGSAWQLAARKRPVSG